MCAWGARDCQRAARLAWLSRSCPSCSFPAARMRALCRPRPTASIPPEAATTATHVVMGIWAMRGGGCFPCQRLKSRACMHACGCAHLIAFGHVAVQQAVQPEVHDGAETQHDAHEVLAAVHSVCRGGLQGCKVAPKPNGPYIYDPSMPRERAAATCFAMGVRAGCGLIRYCVVQSRSGWRPQRWTLHPPAAASCHAASAVQTRCISAEGPPPKRIKKQPTHLSWSPESTTFLAMKHSAAGSHAVHHDGVLLRSWQWRAHASMGPSRARRWLSCGCLRRAVQHGRPACAACGRMVFPPDA